MDVRDVNRELRASLWPALRADGFESRTARAAWRYWAGGVDVIDIQSVGTARDATGCTSFSFSAFVASLPDYLTPTPLPIDRDGFPRPHYWHARLHQGLSKKLSQPWFQPFAQTPRSMTEPKRLHREGLMRVLRRDRHDRPDIWYIRDDGANVAECVDDCRNVVLSTGLRLLDRYHDPCDVVRMVHGDELPYIRAGSPNAEEILRAAVVACREAHTQ